METSEPPKYHECVGRTAYTECKGLQDGPNTDDTTAGAMGKLTLNADSNHIDHTDIKYSVVNSQTTDGVVSLLTNSFFVDEPLGKAIGVKSPEDIEHWLHDYLISLIEQEASVCAIDPKTNTVIGVSINVVKEKGIETSEMLQFLDPEKDWKLCEVALFLQSLYHQLDLFQEYQVESAFCMAFLNVDGAYGGKGIAHQLATRSVEIARSQGIPIAFAETTGIYSAKVFQKLGFSVVQQIDYKNYKKDGKVIFADTGVHDAARVLLKKIV